MLNCCTDDVLFSGLFPVTSQTKNCEVVALCGPACKSDTIRLVTGDISYGYPSLLNGLFCTSSQLVSPTTGIAVVFIGVKLDEISDIWFDRRSCVTVEIRTVHFFIFFLDCGFAQNKHEHIFTNHFDKQDNKQVFAMSFDHSYAYSFPAVRGIQAGREYYVAMCPLKVIPKIFVFNEDELPAEIRAQRTLNQSRVPEMARYLLQNQESYVFSALTASIDGDTVFDPIGDEFSPNGILHASMDGDFIINDGQHRRAAISEAIKQDPDLGDESIAVVFFVDRGIKRAQQMFTDLNKYAVRPSPSLNVLYDHRDPKAYVIRQVVLSSAFFKDLVEMERSNLVQRSRRLFTLSALHSATCVLLADLNWGSQDENIALASSFWEAVAGQFRDWQLVHEGIVKASEVRMNYLHTHGVVLQAIGQVGNTLIREHQGDWSNYLSGLSEIDWSRANPDWEGRAMVMGRVKKARENIGLTANYIKLALGLPLNEEGCELEQQLKSGEIS